MAFFAEIDAQNIITRVIVVDDNILLNEIGEEDESLGVQFCQEITGSSLDWVQTAIDNSIRERYAGIGYSFRENIDAFLTPQPFPSWDVDETIKDWAAPIEKPTFDAELQFVIWDESAVNWVIVDFPVVS